MSANLPKKKKKLQTSKKLLSWRHLGPKFAKKSSAKRWIRTGEILSLEQKSINEVNDCVMKSERGALVFVGAKAHPRFTVRSVHTTAIAIRPAPIRRLRTNYLAAGV